MCLRGVYDWRDPPDDQARSARCSDNNMTGIPGEIGDLSRLKPLDYSQNKITNLPNQLAKLSGTLKELNLTGNPIDQATINNLKASLPNTTIIF